MVQLLLDGFGGDCRRGGRSSSHGIECYHVNARFSEKLEDIGDFRPGKLILLLGYCLQAIWVRFRYGVKNFYYVPAPGKPSALYRDWLVLLVCRPFFQRTILHWHAAGLAKWLETAVPIRVRAITYRAARQVDLSIVLSNYGRGDAAKLFPRRIAVVGNGIPDPCPTFAAAVLPRRQARLQVRQLLRSGSDIPPDLRAAAGEQPEVFQVLFMAHCTREKGLFEAVQGVILAQHQLQRTGSPLSIRLQVAGEFMDPHEKQEFEQLCRTAGGQVVTYVGFVGGERKRQILEQADLFCFPSHLESFGLVLAEAMAFGLPIITTRSGALPEVLSEHYGGLVDAQSPEQVASTLIAMMDSSPFQSLRQRFETHFTVHNYLAQLASVLRSVEREPLAATPQPIGVSAA